MSTDGLAGLAGLAPQVARTSNSRAPRLASALALALALAASACGGGEEGGETSSGSGEVEATSDSESASATSEASSSESSEAEVTGGDGDGDGDTGGDGDGDVSDGRPAGVFGGGPFYNEADTVLPRMKASGFNTLILWTIHVNDNGDLVLNDVLLVHDGQWMADAGWPAKVEDLKVPPTSVTRVEFGVGSAGVPDFERIATLIAAEGTGPTSILHRNFSVLKAQMPSVDAFNFDDESAYDVAPTVEFSLMLADMGYQISLVPYEASNFWASLYTQVDALRPGVIDRVMLQKYAGGVNNNPASWAGLFDGLEIEVGLWSKHGNGCVLGDDPSTVQSKLESYGDASVGGWMWLLDDMLACDATYPLEDYATAIHAAYPAMP